MGLEHLAGKPDDADATIDPQAAPDTSQVEQQGQDLQVEDIEDVDDAELRSALADAGAEEPEGQSQPPQDSTDPTLKTPAAPAEPNADGEPPASGPVMIPKPRFDEVLDRAKKAERIIAEQAAEAIRLKQQLEQHTGPAVNPELSALDAQIDELAEKFDAGEITFKDMNAQKRVLDARRDQIREQEIVNRAAARAVEAVPKAPTGNDGWLAERTAEIQAQYGAYVDAIPQGMFDAVIEQVRDGLIAKGENLTGDRGSAILREAIGQYAKQEHAFFARASGIAPIKDAAPNGQPAPRPTPGNMPTPDQRRAKLQLQEAMPPSLSGMHRATGSDTMLSEAQIEEMDEEAIAELPVATRNRLLGLS